MTETGEITRILEALRAGKPDAFDRLVFAAYQKLRQIAHNRLRGKREWTLDTTGLVHEAYIKMSAQTSWDLRDRGEFLAASSVAMKQIIIQFARRRAADKRGGGRAVSVTLDERNLAIDDQAELLLELNLALEGLRECNERLARVVECRFFAGLSEEDTAQALGVSLRTAQRDWMRARAWLQDALSS